MQVNTVGLIVFSSFISFNLPIKFPLSQFLNITYDVLCNGIDWKTSRNLCDDLLCNGINHNGDENVCDCADTCFVTKSCCIDKLWNETHPLLLDEYVKYFLNVSNAVKKHVCEPLLDIKKNTYDIDKIMLVHSCLNDADNLNTKLCLNTSNRSYISNLPVFGSDNTFYRNAACAQCNNIINFENVTLSARCDERNPTNQTTFNPKTIHKNNSLEKNNLFDEFKYCRIALKENSLMRNFTQRCITNCFDGCSITNPNYEMCKAYSGEFKGFKNFHCYLCNPGIFRLCTKQKSKVKDSVHAKTWSFTINFHDNNEASLSDIKFPDITCLYGYLQSKVTGKCELNKCPPGYTLQDKTCKGNTYEILRLQYPTFEKCLLENTIFMFVIMDESNNVLEKSGFRSVNISEKGRKEVLAYKKVANISLELILRKTQQNLLNKTYKLYVAFQANLNFTEIYGFQPERYFNGNRTCAEFDLYNANDGIFTETCNFNINNFQINRSDYTIFITVGNKLGIKHLVSVCRRFHLNKGCVLQKIFSNYTIYENKSASITVSGNTHNFASDQYLPLTEGLGVCYSQILSKNYILKEQTSKDIFIKLEYYSSLIGTAVSAVCYIIIISIYLKFRELRKVANYNVTALCTSLLFSDITFIVFTQTHQHDDFCKYLGVLLHFSLLIPPMWTAIIAFDLVSKFGSIHIPHQGLKQFYTYIFVSIAAPLVIITISISLDQTDTVYFGYAEKCWISGLEARIITYVAPIGFSFAIAISSLSYTIFKIYWSKRSNEKALGTSKSANITVYKIAIKLVIILGVTEMSGLIQIRKKILSKDEIVFNEIFTIIYTYCRSLKGVMLLLVYVCKKDVYRLTKSSITTMKTIGLSQFQEIPCSTNKCSETKL